MPDQLPDYQKHRIASCAAAGLPVEHISKATGLPVETIQRQLKQPTEAMKQLIDHERFQQNAMLIKFKMETSVVLNDAINFAKEYIRDGADARLRWDISKDILSAHGLIFPRDRAAAPQVNTQINIHNDQRTIDAMEAVSSSIRESTVALRGSLPAASSITGNRHIHVSQADIVEPPAPTQTGEPGGSPSPEAESLSLQDLTDLRPPKGNGRDDGS